MSPLKGALELIGMSSLTLFGTPAFAVEPDIDSPAGPELQRRAQIVPTFS
jgi:hypothetical protein